MPFFIGRKYHHLIITLCFVVGVVYLFHHVHIQESIMWAHFNLQKDWNLVQVGMVLLFLQVSRWIRKKNRDKKKQ